MHVCDSNGQQDQVQLQTLREKLPCPRDTKQKQNKNVARGICALGAVKFQELQPHQSCCVAIQMNHQSGMVLREKRWIRLITTNSTPVLTPRTFLQQCMTHLSRHPPPNQTPEAVTDFCCWVPLAMQDRM